MNPAMANSSLKKFFEGLGFKNVTTIIASGNVIFQSDSNNSSALEKKIETELPKKLKFSSTTFIRSLDDLTKIADNNLFKGKEDLPESRFNITFLKEKPYEIPTIIDTVNLGTSKIMLELEKEHGKQITTRTWKTVEKIIRKME